MKPMLFHARLRIMSNPSKGSVFSGVKLADVLNAWKRKRVGTAILLASLVSCVAAANTHAEETCWTEGPSQFADGIQYCVSSVLPSQEKWNYGPKNLVGYYGSVGAWCEGIQGPGIGETISLRIDRAPPFRRLSIKNGYNKSKASFANNGRVKRMRITSDTGIDTTVMLEDRMGEQIIDLPKVAQHQWLKLKILDVYPGKKFSDTCIDDIGPDFVYEEELLQQRQPPPQACLPSGTAISGHLEIHEETHPAGYQMRSFHLVPAEPLCVVAGDEQLAGVRRIQLAPVSDEQQQELKEGTGRRFTVNGTFYMPHTAWHTGDVLLTDLEIVAKTTASEVASIASVAKSLDITSNLEIDTNRGGMDIRSLDLPAAEPELCETECAKDPQCKAFTYVKPGVQSRSARCWLKHGVPLASRDTCCISGVKTKDVAVEVTVPDESIDSEELSGATGSDSALADLSVVQQEVIGQHGWPQTFTLLFYANDDTGAAVRQETWNYHDANLSFTFVDGELISQQSPIGSVPDALYPEYRPDQFSAGMTLEDAFRALPKVDEYVQEQMPDETMSLYWVRALIMGFIDDQLVYLETRPELPAQGVQGAKG